jgi:hypothetical protein
VPLLLLLLYRPSLHMLFQTLWRMPLLLLLLYRPSLHMPFQTLWCVCLLSLLLLHQPLLHVQPLFLHLPYHCTPLLLTLILQA